MLAAMSWLSGLPGGGCATRTLLGLLSVALQERDWLDGTPVLHSSLLRV